MFKVTRCCYIYDRKKISPELQVGGCVIFLFLKFLVKLVLKMNHYSQKLTILNKITPEESRFLAAYSNNNNCSGESEEEIFTHLFFTVVKNKDDAVAVTEILKLANETKFDLATMWFRQWIPHNQIDFSHACLINNPKSFQIITDFGGINKYYNHSCVMYFKLSISMTEYCWSFYERQESEMYLKALNNVLNGKVTENETTLRLSQLIFLYARSKSYWLRPGDEFENTLRVLWSSISEPLLTFTDLCNLFDGEKVKSKIWNIWYWYCKLIRRDFLSFEKGPRSLKHLCRCAIRQRLKECFQLPEGIKKLVIPKSIEQYLLLKDTSDIN